MSTLFLALRLIHVLFGAVWLGFGLFVPFLLAPALQDAGPESGGKVMGALQRRGLMVVLPLVALTTIVSGAWLFWLVSGGELHRFAMTPTGHILSVGALAAIVAYIIGISVSRPAMLKAGAIMQSLASITAEEERVRMMAEAGRLRARGLNASKLVAVLLVVAAAAMAVARYWIP
jgi:uncharacterized membrane protein